MRKMGWRERLGVLFRGRMAVVHETDSTIAIGKGFNEVDRDRYDYDRLDILKDSLDAWRFNPLARRITELTTQYVVGQGIALNCKHDSTLKFIKDFWNNRLNRMEVRSYEMCDELTRSGNLFVILSTDAAGMSYIRCLPAEDVDKIDTLPNDIEQPVLFWPKATAENLDPAPYQAYDEQTDSPDESGNFRPVMLQYAINRPVGGQWGESDLAPILKWLSRYSAWLEDRARLNRFRNSFLFVVKAQFTNEAERAARQATLAANPPGPGSILVTDASETWDVLSPKLEASDANTDGLALKKMVASGSGVPMHFLAEPEGSTRTTAEAAGGPTYRHFEQRQKYFLWILQDILKVAVSRRKLLDSRVSRKAEIEVRGADISARDNVSLGMAASNITAVLTELRKRNLVDNDEFLRIVYRFAGEFVDIPEMLKRAKAEGIQPADITPLPTAPGAPAAPKAQAGDQKAKKDLKVADIKPAGKSSDINQDTGELKPTVENPQ